MWVINNFFALHSCSHARFRCGSSEKILRSRSARILELCCRVGSREEGLVRLVSASMIWDLYRVHSMRPNEKERDIKKTWMKCIQKGRHKETWWFGSNLWISLISIRSLPPHQTKINFRSSIIKKTQVNELTSKRVFGAFSCSLLVHHRHTYMWWTRPLFTRRLLDLFLISISDN